jgi:hypothetical protein
VVLRGSDEDYVVYSIIPAILFPTRSHCSRYMILTGRFVVLAPIGRWQYQVGRLGLLPRSQQPSARELNFNFGSAWKIANETNGIAIADAAHD